MGRKNAQQAQNFCIKCGRPTTEKKSVLSSIRDYFFICPDCQKVWCLECYSALIGKSQKKTFRRGKKNKIKCIDCKQIIPIKKLPKNVGFKQMRVKGLAAVPIGNQMQQQQQGQAQNITINLQGQTDDGVEIEMKYCSHCGKQIKQDAVFCEFCGGKQ